MRFDLKTPCKNCPFRTDETAIRFACRERAEEIEEQAYRLGFPCHLSAEHIEGDDDPFGDGGFKATETSQQCAGHTIMSLREGAGAWPSIMYGEGDEDGDKRYEQLEGQVENETAEEKAERVRKEKR